MANDLEIALRVQAKFDEARKALQDLAGDVQALDAAGKAASESEPAASRLAETAPQATDAVKQTTAATKEHTEANKALTQAQKEQAEAADRATKAEKDLGKEQENQTQQSHKNEEQQQRQAKGSDDAAAAAAQEKAAVDQLIASLDPAATAAQRLAAAQASLDAALAKGQITQEQHAQRLAQVRQQLNDVVPATEREKAALDRLIASLDPATAAAQRMAAAQAALDSALAKGLITQDQYTRYLAQAQKQLGGLGVSAGQTAAAMRQLPAQITDITTSLASGMPVWLVAIQQGGQIRDSFGGIGPALRGIASLVTPAAAAIGALGAAVIAVSVAYVQAQREASGMRSSIVMSGNAAGVTMDQLYGMARATSDVVGTQSKAIGVLREMSESGKIANDNMQRFTQVALQLDVVGKSAESTVKELVELGKAPVAASEKLNEKYGYLTTAVYRQIQALMEQGRETEAANLAQETYANEMERRARDLTEHLGWIEKAWNACGAAAAWAWDKIKDIGRPATASKILKDAQKELDTFEKELRDVGRTDNLLPADKDKLEALRAIVQAQKDQIQIQKNIALAQENEIERQREGIAATKEQNKLIESGLSKQAKMQKELQDNEERIAKIRRADPESPLLKPEAIKASEDAIRDKYKERGGGRPRRDNTLTAQVRADLRTLQDAIKQSDALLVRAVEDGKMGIDTAYQQRLADLKTNTEAQRKELQAELDNPKTRKERRIDIEAQLTLLESSAAKTASDIERWHAEQQRKLQDLQVRLRVDVSQLTGEVDAEAIRKQLESQYRDMRIAAGRSDDIEQAAQDQKRIDMLIDAAAQQAAFNARLEEARRLQSQLGVLEEAVNQQAQRGQISQIEAEAQIRAARAAQVPMLQSIVAELQQVRDAMPSGAAAAIDNMSVSIGNLQNSVAAATPVVVDLGTKLRNQVVDALPDALANSIANFKSLREVASSTLRGIAAEIVRSNIKGLLQDLLPDRSGAGGGTSFFGAVVGGIRSIFGFAEGGQIRGPGTGTSDSIPALVDGRRPIAVSNGEFIHPERAVRHYGLPFMEAIRTLRLPRPQFAFGGLVAESRRARFATGGSVGGAAGSTAGATAMPNIKIEVVNMGTPQQVRDYSAQLSGRDMVVRVVLDDYRNNGPISRVANAKRS